MKKHVFGSIAVGMCLVVASLAATAVPAYAQRGGGGAPGGGGMAGGGAWHGGGGGGSHGGGGSWQGGGGSWQRSGGSWQGHGGWHGGSGWHGGGWGWRGGWGGWGWWGPSVVVGAGPFWGWPYGYPYGYCYPYAYPYSAYSPPVVVESSPQTYIQQEPQAQQYWYYCQNPQGYYPYVTECPGGWQPVSPQPPPPAR